MLKIKLSFLLLFLVMHSQNVLSILFTMYCNNPNWFDDYTGDPRFVGFESNDGSFSHNYTPTAYDRRFNGVFSAVVRDMLLTPVTFSRESLPRGSAFNGQVTIDGQTLAYTFTVIQLGFRENQDVSYPINDYMAIFMMPGTGDVYRIEGSGIPETQGEDTGEEILDEGTVDEIPNETLIEPTINNPENGPYTNPENGPYTNPENEPYTNPENVTYTSHELNRSWWGRLTNPFTNLLFKPNSR